MFISSNGFTVTKDSIVSSKESNAFRTINYAAFCDLKQYDDARKCYKMAVARSHGNVSPELMNVKKRIEKEEQEQKYKE